MRDSRPAYANVHDTLLAHHAFASHLPQRLDHVVSEYCDARPWKVEFGQRGGEEKGIPSKIITDGDDLTVYNASDCKLTALAWHRLQPDLEPERRVYDHDRKLTRVCHEMAWRGVFIDRERQAELAKACAKERRVLLKKMRRIAGPDFQPGKLAQVRTALFSTLGGAFIARTPGGEPSTASLTLETFAANPDTKIGKFCALLLRWRLVGKIKGTYLDPVPVNARTGAAHYNWRSFGTVSGRLACRLQSVPRYDARHAHSRVREIYVARPGHTFVYFDVSQAEMRIAAYLANDPEFIAACAGDVHANNAKAVFPDVAARGWLDGDAKKDPMRGKPYRDIAKNLGFAIGYLAEAETVYAYLRGKGFNVTLRAVIIILAKLHAKYTEYFRFVNKNIARVKVVGHMRTPRLGRIRWLGWFPKPTDVANSPIQSTLADIINERMIANYEAHGTWMHLVMQHHDACVYEVLDKNVERAKKILQEQWDHAISLAGGKMVLPIDLKSGQRWSEF